MHGPPYTVAVLDSDPDTRELLRTVLDLKGFTVVTASVSTFRLGHDDLLAFFGRTNPDVIVYDLGIPYEENWNFLQAVRRNPAFPPCGVVITTTNRRAVETLLGVEAIEIIGKPYDLERIAEAVQSAATGESGFPDEVGEGSERRRNGQDRRSGRPRRTTDGGGFMP